MNIELEKKEAEQILGNADSLKIQQYLTKRELKKIQRKFPFLFQEFSKIFPRRIRIQNRVFLAAQLLKFWDFKLCPN